MKRNILISLLLVMFINSCVTYYYYVDTDVLGDMSVDRKVYASSPNDHGPDMTFVKSGEWKDIKVAKPFNVDFYDGIVEMTEGAAAHVDDLGASRFNVDSVNVSNPLMEPVETVGKRFAWFYTYYDYKAVFRNMREELPLPLDGYLTNERQALYFRGENPPQGWNGIEMYCLLSDINRMFADWYADAMFLTLCDIYKPYCSDIQNDILYYRKDDFMEVVSKEMMLVMEPGQFAARMEDIVPGSGFPALFQEREKELEAAYSEETSILDRFSYSFIYSISMPGRYLEGNAPDFIDGIPVWKVDGYRLLYDDVVMEATFRKINVWAFLLTFAAIAILLQFFSKVFSRR